MKGQLPSLDFYVYDTWELDRVLPWSHIQGPLPVETLKKHLAQSIPSDG